MLDNINYSKETVDLLKKQIIKSCFKHNPSNNWEHELNQKINHALASQKALNIGPIAFCGTPGDGKTSLYKQLAEEVADELGLNFIENPYRTPSHKDFLFVVYNAESFSFSNKNLQLAGASTVLFDDLHSFSQKQQIEVLDMILKNEQHLTISFNNAEKENIIKPILNRIILIESKNIVLRQINNLRETHTDLNSKISNSL